MEIFKNNLDKYILINCKQTLRKTNIKKAIVLFCNNYK